MARFRLYTYLLSFLLISASLWAAQSDSTEPNPNSCLHRLSNSRAAAPFSGVWQNSPNLIGHFQSYSRVLMLADGPELRESSLIARTYPDKEVVGTDLLAKPVKDPLPNLRGLVLDTRKVFPFEGNSFDLIYMRKGLCHCSNENRACCGIRKEPKAIKHFLSEVVRVLDKNAAHSTVVLDGRMPEGAFVLWKYLCDEVASHNGLRCIAQVETAWNTPVYRGFLIRR